MSVRRHTIYNVVGSILPMGLSFVTVPIYLKLVGPDRYGVLSIAWLLLGYFGLFDLGLGRATSFRIASLRDASGEQRARTFWAALAVNVGMGALGGLVLYFAANFFFQHVFKVSDALRAEMVGATPLLAAAVPVATMMGVLTGAMQGRERFFETNLISVLSTALFQLFPLTIAWLVGPHLPLLLAGAIGARLVAAVVMAARCYAEIVRGYLPRVDRAEIKALLQYGGWVSLTSLFGPLLFMVDRFTIGAVLGARAVTDYTVPLQLAGRMQVFPGALTTAMFPKLSAASEETQYLLGRKATQTLCALLTLPYLAAIFAIAPFLQLWVGRNLGPDASLVGRILLISMWVNAFALVPFTKLQASGRPDLVTKVMLIEIPPYFLILYVLMTRTGLAGAALALCLRSILDFILLTWNARRRFDDLAILTANFALLVVGASLAGLWTIFDWRFWAAALVVGAFTAAAGYVSIPADIKSQLIARAGAVIRRGAAMLGSAP